MMFVRLVAVTVGPTVAMVSAILSQASSFDVFLDSGSQAKVSTALSSPQTSTKASSTPIPTRMKGKIAQSVLNSTPQTPTAMPYPPTIEKATLSTAMHPNMILEDSQSTKYRRSKGLDGSTLNLISITIEVETISTKQVTMRCKSPITVSWMAWSKLSLCHTYPFVYFASLLNLATAISAEANHSSTKLA